MPDRATRDLATAPLEAEIARLKAERDALVGLIVQPYHNRPPNHRVMLGGVWPGTPGRPETYAPGWWDASGDLWCYDRREDAVAAVRRAAGLEPEPAGGGG